ncbi:MAG: aminotransferase class I/II-fold pyridoxal phosphate-dependent enzyme [Tissierellia bacterium]|nr:aminotransferase class I/II-fold pyridoxal phosphate-dependent enzyme [Tissierellia bacterium]
MLNFQNDYHDIAHPKVLQALTDLEGQYRNSYGFDSASESAREKIQKRLGRKAAVHFVPGGSTANVLALTYLLKPHECVVSVASGHIVNDEVGGVEAVGHKVNTIPSETGLMDPEALDRHLKSYGDFHNVLPKVVYISNATETGRVYDRKTLEELFRVSEENNCYLYIDGARMGAALGSEENDLAFEDYGKLCHMFSIGGTKNGALFGEALVFNEPELFEEFIYFQKQQLVLMAKGFVLGAQFDALFTDDLLFEIGKKASAQGKKVAKILEEQGYKLTYPCDANQVFVTIGDDELVKKLQEEARCEVMGATDEGTILRFVTTYETTDGEIEALRELLQSI